MASHCCSNFQFLITDGVDHLSICLFAIYMFSLMRCLFRSFDHFLIGCFPESFQANFRTCISNNTRCLWIVVNMDCSSNTFLFLLCTIREWVILMSSPGGPGQRGPEITYPHFLLEALREIGGLSGWSEWGAQVSRGNHVQGVPDIGLRRCHPCPDL